MRSVRGVGAARASRWTACFAHVGALVTAGFAASGCSTPAALGLAANARGATVTIESVEGAPATVFHRYLREINTEAAERNVALVLWGGAASYRLRGYLAAHTS